MVQPPSLPELGVSVASCPAPPDPDRCHGTFVDMSIARPQSLTVQGGVRLSHAGSGPLTALDGRIATSTPDGFERHRDATVDADGLIIAPGYVDLQINGGFGLDLTTEPESMWELAGLLPRHGVTSFLPTIVSSPPPVTDRALAALKARPSDHRGAEPLGLHFEGPMLHRDRAGAHRVQHLAAPDAKLIAGWSRSNGVTLVTLAPELPGALSVVEHLRAGGIVVSAGHSTATANEAITGFDAGVSLVSHLFNAMRPMGHRDPGLAGAALADDRVAVGLIADGVHIDPIAMKVAWRAKGPERRVLVTDAVAAQGLPPGRHRLGDRVIIADETGVRTEDGRLAGSVLTMDRAVVNTIEFTGCTLADAVVAASTNPADVIVATDRGHLRPGAVADVVLLEPDGSVAITVCRGRIAHVAEGAAGRITT